MYETTFGTTLVLDGAGKLFIAGLLAPKTTGEHHKTNFQLESYFHRFCMSIHTVYVCIVTTKGKGGLSEKVDFGEEEYKNLSSYPEGWIQVDSQPIRFFQIRTAAASGLLEKS